MYHIVVVQEGAKKNYQHLKSEFSEGVRGKLKTKNGNSLSLSLSLCYAQY